MTEVESREAQEIACRLVGWGEALAMEAERGGDHSALIAMARAGFSAWGVGRRVAALNWA